MDVSDVDFAHFEISGSLPNFRDVESLGLDYLLVALNIQMTLGDFVHLVYRDTFQDIFNQSIKLT